MNEFTTFAGSLATVVNAIKGIKELYSTNPDASAKLTEAYTTIQELQVNFLELLSMHIELQSEMETLKQQIATMNSWEEKAARYALKETNGVYVYALKEEHHTEEPNHTICPHCYAKHIISIMSAYQPNSPTRTCPECKWHYCLNDYTKVRSRVIM